MTHVVIANRPRACTYYLRIFVCRYNIFASARAETRQCFLGVPISRVTCFTKFCAPDKLKRCGERVAKNAKQSVPHSVFTLRPRICFQTRDLSGERNFDLHKICQSFHFSRVLDTRTSNIHFY